MFVGGSESIYRLIDDATSLQSTPSRRFTICHHMVRVLRTHLWLCRRSLEEICVLGVVCQTLAEQQASFSVFRTNISMFSTDSPHPSLQTVEVYDKGCQADLGGASTVAGVEGEDGGDGGGARSNSTSASSLKKTPDKRRNHLR